VYSRRNFPHILVSLSRHRHRFWMLSDHCGTCWILSHVRQKASQDVWNIAIEPPAYSNDKPPDYLASQTQQSDFPPGNGVVQPQVRRISSNGVYYYTHTYYHQNPIVLQPFRNNRHAEQSVIVLTTADRQRATQVYPATCSRSRLVQSPFHPGLLRVLLLQPVVWSHCIHSGRYVTAKHHTIDLLQSS
jgi:hypothetical protein